MKSKEELKFRKYIKDNREIRRKLNKIAGWTSEEFQDLINLLKKGEEANFDCIKEITK